jgi:hypothetical protein
MRIHARELGVGDVLAIHDWHLHVTGVEAERAVAVRTAEFDFLMHFLREDVVDVDVRAPRKAA